MLTKFIVIQKIEADGQVDVFQASSDNFQWTFETRRTKIDKDKEYFPFTLFGNINIFKRQPGAETRTYTRDNELTFCDDYGVPGGIVIGILFPQNFVPDIIKFKDKPFIPVGFAGQVSSRPPGQLQIFYNHLEKRCAIVFNIHENICFGFKCVSKKVTDNDFPRNESVIADDLFDISISREFLNIDAIKNEDLKIINETVNQTDLTEINTTLNEILNALKAGQKEKAKSLLDRFGKLILNGTSLAGNLTKIADSYRNGGTVQHFVGKIIEYVSL